MEKLTIKDLPKQVVEEMTSMIKTSEEYIAIEKVRNRLLREGRYIEATRESARLKQIEERTINLFLERHREIKYKLDSITDKMSDKDLEMFGAYTNGIVMLADVLETLIIESNQILKKYVSDARMDMFDEFKELLDKASSIVRLLDGKEKDSFYIDKYGDMTDNLCEMIVNKGRSFFRKTKEHELSKMKK